MTFPKVKGHSQKLICYSLSLPTHELYKNKVYVLLKSRKIKLEFTLNYKNVSVGF